MKLSKIVAIHQPNYLPWLGYFYKIYQSDVFVFLDDVQFSNKGMHDYTYIKTANGSFRLKYPINQKFEDKIMDVSSKDHLGWKKKHLDTIQMNYKKAPFFNNVFEEFKSVLLQDYPNIVELNIALIKHFASKLEIECDFVKSSELGVDGAKTDRILAICNKVGASIYYSGNGARAYQNEDDFNANNVELRYSMFKPFEYEQLWGEFQSNVTAIDYFMNCGYDWGRVINSQL